MSEAIKQLSSLGVQKIYEDTHIPSHHIQAILHHSFDDFTKVQFLGFISILEKEYSITLKASREAALAHFGEQEERHLNDNIFIVPNKQKAKAPIYISIVVVLIAITLLLNYFILNPKIIQKHKVDNSLISSVQESIVSSRNETIEQNSTIAVASDSNMSLQKETNTSKAIEKSFKIIPRSKVWLGYIEVQTNKKHQVTFDEEMSLDPNKEWLLFFGHGYVDMFINGKIQKFDSRNKIRFLYKNQTLTAISSSEFEDLNRGLKW